VFSIAQARTGTGKTIGFLLPAIQNILRKNPELAERKQYSKARPSDIRVIIISPTRELAEQIAVEAQKLCVDTDLRVQVAVGGNSKSAMLKKMQREGCHLLVATPGRLNDILTDPYSGVAAPNLNTLILDEADRLLDQGFASDIEDIIELLPDRRDVDRQTLLFSATVPREVMHLVRRTLKPNFQFVQTVQEGELATHEKVPQRIVVLPGLENYLPSLLELAKREITKARESEAAGGDVKPFKAIVYFNSTANVELSACIFRELRAEGGTFGKHLLDPAEILEIHSKLTQQRRTLVSERFRSLKSGILFSTDVTARGMHFPNVTHVVQIGTPPSQEQYVHRIGRTGRADQTGEGWIFVAEHEINEARQRLRGLPISPDKTLEASKLDMTREAKLPASLATTLDQLSAAVKIVDRETKAKAYQGALGQVVGTPREHVAALNRWTRYGWGWPQPPPVSKVLAARLGISRVPGINDGMGRPDDDFGDVNELNGPRRRREGYLDDFPSDSRRFDRDSRGPFGRTQERGRGRDRDFGRQPRRKTNPQSHF
jgi:ATP-dependent RNA helicase MSS116